MHLVPEILAGTHVDAIVRLPRYVRLTQAEREEVVRIAQGFTPGDSAAAVNISPNRMRARRRRIYGKLRVACAAELRAVILSVARRHGLDPGDESSGSGEGSGYPELTGGP